MRHHYAIRQFCLLPVLVLGLMGSTAVDAQAVNLSDGGQSASFLVKGETALAKPGVTFSATQVGTGTLLAPGRMDILCTTGTATGEFQNSTDLLVTATFSGCTVWQPIKLGEAHKVKMPCTVKEPIVASALGLPKKHEGAADYVLLEPHAGGFFTILFLSGPECPLTKENKISGSIIALVDNNGTAQPLLLFNHAIQELFQVGSFGDHLKFGAFELYLDGEATAKLTDAAHIGFTVGVC